MNVDVRDELPAPPDVVFGFLADRFTWPSWSGHDRFELIQPGDTDPQGVGAIGHLHKGRKFMREQIVEYRPGRRVSYTLLSGLPLKDYRADIDIEPNASGGTTIRWRSTGKAPLLSGWLYSRALTVFIKRAIAGLRTRVSSPTASTTA